MKHKVIQGETLSSIAKHYGFGSIDVIYNHSDNANFKSLRPNPDIIHVGDEIYIPDIFPAKYQVELNKKITFIRKRPKETLSLLLNFEEDEETQGADIEAILIVDDVEYASKSDADGLVEWKLPKTSTRTGVVKLFLEPDQNEATHAFEVKLGDLNPVSENTGIQARLNGLGFDCGRIDNKLKDKSETAIRKFQEVNGLTVDGIAGLKTQQALENKYGC
jgi:hypothetical protein